MISVIVPTYNRLRVLPRALESVLNQTYRDWELIVVDDGSTDGTAEWLATSGLPARIITTTNGGVSRARNLGANEARGDWLAFLDSDDEWLPDKLAKQMELSHKFKLIHGEEIWIRNGVRVNQMKKHAKSGGRLFRRCAELLCISPSTAMIQRELFLSFGGFREDFPVCEDYELWLRVCAIEETGFVQSPVIKKYGGHPDQLSTTFKAMDYYRVKALVPFLTNSQITAGDRELVADVIVKKTAILLSGYQKHQNMGQVSEVTHWQMQALRNADGTNK